MAVVLPGVLLLSAWAPDSLSPYRKYGNITPEKYLTGQFNPRTHPFFVSPEKYGIPVRGSHHLLRREAAEALSKLYRDFHRAHPDVPFLVRSSTRTFYDQKYIWESKWNGKRTVNGMKLDRDVKDPVERAGIILCYSSMPGTSRHHWGTEVDLNALNNRYFTTGRGRVLYTWLCRNAGKYGFCRPYTRGRKGGYKEERWHWSYAPLAVQFLRDWNRLFIHRPGYFSRPGFFRGSRFCGSLAHEYVNTISRECR